MEKMLLNNIKTLKIRYKKEIIQFKSFEELMLKNIIHIFDNTDRKILFIGIEKELLSILLIIVLSIKQYYENMKNPDNNILDTIKNGDKVFYNGRIVVFNKIDIDEREKKEYIYLLEKDNSKTMIPREKQYLLSVYNGQASRINKVNGVSQRYNITKKFISKITDVNTAQLNGVIKESTIVVFEQKEELYNLINSIEINFEEENHAISELFSFAYYTSEDNYEYFKGNRTKENPIIKFVSNINTAIDIIRDDENVKNIVLIGDKTYKDSLETELRQAGMMDSIRKILVIDTWESNFDFSLLVKDDEPFNVYALSKEVILENINLYNKFAAYIPSNLQLRNNHMIENLLNKDVHVYEVENSEILNENIYNINQKLKDLFDYSDNNIKILEYIKISYFLCNKLEHSLLPLNKCEDNQKGLIYRVNMLKEIMNLFPVQRVEHNLMNNIIFEIEKIIEFLKFNNYKIETIKNKILKNNKSLLDIKNIDEIGKLEEYFRTLRKSNLSIKKIDKKTEIYQNEAIIIPAYYENKYLNILNTNIVRCINIVAYRREKIRVKSLIRKNTEMLNLILKNNKLSNNEDYDLPRIVEHLLVKSNFIENKQSYNEEEKFNEIESEVQRVIQENKIKLFINEDKASRGMSNSTMQVNKIVTFEDENYSFLSDNYQANIVDRNSNDIKQKSITELNVGDEMIFTKSKLSGEEDIVKVIIKELLGNKIFNDEYGEYFKLNNLWKNCLKVYMQKDDLTEKDISNKLRIYGKQITHSAIVNWLNGNIIGPQDVKDIKFIADIVKDITLNDKLEEVINACRQERSIQRQIRKAIAKIIINSVINNNEQNDEIYKIVKNTIGDLDKYAYIGIISSIESIHEELSSQHVNKVIERDE
ncbi:hypothetical protein D2A34_19165 [Clostridium chromiireducens]|uniref:DISARM protein DrmE C-terminal domain-containing protein n=1 Tax=Clostridium chromiireducens TaxID=225345 RepID=A0A399IIW5_9CLOT|nr:DrmE family protein [Clostridium chromiireducens]RII32958.1 hypothetical protein D2A34_19165 [Clostridium chromiireducens]